MLFLLLRQESQLSYTGQGTLFSFFRFSIRIGRDCKGTNFPAHLRRFPDVFYEGTLPLSYLSSYIWFLSSGK